MRSAGEQESRPVRFGDYRTPQTIVLWLTFLHFERTLVRSGLFPLAH